jgi:two-component system phosphate regulon sensor histidine kinase PhoR
MKKLFFWLMTLAIGLAIIITLFVIIIAWFWLGQMQVEFELTGIHLLYLIIGLWLILFVSLYLVFYKPFIEVKNLLSENPFSDIYAFNIHGFNPFVAIKKAIKKNNDKSHAELEKLNTLEQYRREYIGNVSHELKTPIFNIQGYVEALLDGGLDDKNVNRHFLEKADKNVERMINIVMDLQTISRFEAGELELEKENFGIYQLVEDVIETEKENAAKNNISFELYTGKEVLVNADKFRIRQVLTNLLVNSIKYGKPKGGETHIRIYDLDNYVKVEISDNGIGMDEKHLGRIFERFYRVDSSRSREKGGSGLGLAIVKHIIEAHGQTIEVMSTPGVGTVFSFSLSKPMPRD